MQAPNDPQDYEDFVIIANPSHETEIATTPLTTKPMAGNESKSLQPRPVSSPTQPQILSPTNSTKAFQPPSSSTSPPSSASEAQTATSSPTTTKPSLTTLPAELIPHISLHLPYPDLLALRHTHPRFLYTPLLERATHRKVKVEWLDSRYQAGLPIVTHGSLRLDSDAAFCTHPEIRAIMIARRRHSECKGGEVGGCSVVEGATCAGAVGDGRRGVGSAFARLGSALGKRAGRWKLSGLARRDRTAESVAVSVCTLIVLIFAIIAGLWSR